MCGIAGLIALDGEPPDSARIGAMCDAMQHRGPDDAGYLVEGRVALGMRRLSIIDVAGGHQPIYNEDGSVAVFFNGEIYNFRELRRQLEAQGHTFATNSDTEVIVHLWEQVGIDFPRHLNGMFAIALYDRKQRKIVLARDHVGIKPLYYARVGASLVFGSEIKVVLASGRVERRLDYDALGQFLAWEYVPGDATLLRAVRRLKPASTLELDLQSGAVAIREYWDPMRLQSASSKKPDAEWEDELDATIARCVRNQMVSDVPIGAFLSGGVDSSLVVAAMGRAETFSIGFDDPTYNETAWSARVAKHLGVNHRIEIIRPQARELFDHLMQFMDDPIGDFSIFPTYLVSKLARQHVTVALSGDGGDELFGGYETYLAQERARAWQRIPGILATRRHRAARGSLGAQRGQEGVRQQGQALRGRSEARSRARARALADLFGRSRARELADRAGAGGHAHAARRAHRALHAASRDADSRNQTLYTDFRSYLVDNCLAKVDRMSMACSLEARVPLLDLDVVELAFRLPARLKFNSHETKIALKRVAARHVPRDCVYRPKEGFSIPIKNWLKTEFRDLANTYLDPARLRADGLFQVAEVERLWREHDGNRANHSHILWSLLVFQHWRDRWQVAL